MIPALTANKTSECAAPETHRMKSHEKWSFVVAQAQNGESFTYVAFMATRAKTSQEVAQKILAPLARVDWEAIDGIGRA